MLDHLEQLESDFAAALRPDSIEVFSGDPAVMDEFDREDASQAKEDLAAITMDLPRAKSEVLNAGCQMVGVMADIIAADFKDPVSGVGGGAE